jgi:hypothetical protein
MGLGAAMPARAQFIEGPYVAGGLGMNYLDDAKFRLDSSLNQGMTALGQPNGGQLGFDFGGVGVLSLGWGFSNGIRLEIEGNYRSNEVDSANGAAGLASPGAHGGRQDSYGAMGNALVDLVRIGPFLPYVGIGAGYLVTSFNDLNGRPGNGSLRLRGDDTGGAFALQASEGDAVRWADTTEVYRMYAEADPQIVPCWNWPRLEAGLFDRLDAMRAQLLAAAAAEEAAVAAAAAAAVAVAEASGGVDGEAAVAAAEAGDDAVVAAAEACDVAVEAATEAGETAAAAAVVVGSSSTTGISGGEAI